MLSLFLCSEAHAKALIAFLKTAHVPQETSTDQFKDFVASLTADNGLGFSDTDLTAKGKNHNDALHVSIECRGTTLAHVLVDTGSSLNVLPKKAQSDFHASCWTYKFIHTKFQALIPIFAQSIGQLT